MCFAAALSGTALVTASAALLPAAGVGSAAPAPLDSPRQSGPTLVPMSTAWRRCDHSVSTFPPIAGDGAAYALISRQANQVVADVHLSTADPDTQYGVRLIQMPRSSNSYCSDHSPGTVASPLYADGAGNATITLTADVVPGATGAWVMIEGPQTLSKPYGQMYTSDYVAAI